MNKKKFNGKKFYRDGIEEVKLIEVIDGDTAYFKGEEGNIITRFIGINAPETTKKIEPYGMEANAFTKSRLEGAISIVIESDKEKPELDSTSHRFLCYVWYKKNMEDEYRLFNEEILAAGLAKILIMSNVTKYNHYLQTAYNTAKKAKLKIHGPIDPNYTTNVVETTIKEILSNKEKYINGVSVVVKGMVLRKVSDSFFLFDEVGIYVYNTYYNINTFNVGDVIELYAQFSIDNVYGEQLTNIRGIKVITSNNKVSLPIVKDIKEINNYIGQAIYLDEFTVFCINRVNKISKALLLDCFIGNSEAFRIKVASNIKPKYKNNTFEKSGIYSCSIGVIQFRESFDSDKQPLLLLCNDFYDDLKII